MSYFISAIILIGIFLFWYNKFGKGKGRKKKSGFAPDLSGIKFSGQKCECS